MSVAVRGAFARRIRGESKEPLVHLAVALMEARGVDLTFLLLNRGLRELADREKGEEQSIGAFLLELLAELLRFLLLKVKDVSVTPSPIVESVWSVARLHTQEYEDLCMALTGESGKLLHNDTHTARYTATLGLYRTVFGQPQSWFWPQQEQCNDVQSRLGGDNEEEEKEDEDKRVVIVVQGFSGRDAHFSVKMATKMDEIFKAYVRRQYGLQKRADCRVLLADLCFIVKGRELHNAHISVADCGLAGGSVIHCVARRIGVAVMGQSGRELHFQVKPSTKILKVFEHFVRYQQGLPTDADSSALLESRRFILNGKQLPIDCGTSIADCGLAEGSLIYCIDRC